MLNEGDVLVERARAAHAAFGMTGDMDRFDLILASQKSHSSTKYYKDKERKVKSDQRAQKFQQVRRLAKEGGVHAKMLASRLS